jgi:hypothetical protein
VDHAARVRDTTLAYTGPHRAILDCGEERMSAHPGRVVAVLLVLVAIAWWLALDRPSPPPVTSSADPDPPIAARPAQAQARPALATTVQQPPTARAPSANADIVQPVPAAPAQDLQQEQAATAIAPDTRGFVDALQDVFDGEPRDSAACDGERWIRGVFRDAGSPSGLLRFVLCRQTVCRVELRWTAEDDAPFRRALDELGAVNGKYVATRAQEPDASGAVLVSAYVARAAQPAAAQPAAAPR